MNYSIFGTKTGLVVSDLILGTGMFGQRFGYGSAAPEATDILNGYAEAGGNFLDTADFYQLGEAEEILGRWLGARRNDFVLGSKFGRGDTLTAGLGQLGNHRKAMVQSVEASLKRLKTDRIDLYMAHMPDTVTPAEQLARGFEDLVRAGKIVYGGFSNFPAWRVAAASTAADLRGWAPIAGVQLDYSLLQRDGERELLPMARGLGLGLMAYSPLGGGLLSGKYRRGEAGRATALPGGPVHDAARADRVLDALLAVGQDLGATPSQVAIAWVRAQGVLPIIGPRTRAQLDDNLGAAAVQLEATHLARLAEASATSLGYPHDMMNAPAQRAGVTGGKWDRVAWPAWPVA